MKVLTYKAKLAKQRRLHEKQVNRIRIENGVEMYELEEENRSLKFEVGVKAEIVEMYRQSNEELIRQTTENRSWTSKLKKVIFGA